MHCIAFASTLVETQRKARIDSDLILAFLCVVFLHQIVKILNYKCLRLTKLTQRKILRHILNQRLGVSHKKLVPGPAVQCLA